MAYLVKCFLLIIGTTVNFLPLLAATTDIRYKQLSSLLDSSKPWTHIESLEEQPVAFIGGPPRTLAFSLPQPSTPQIPLRIKEVGENEFPRILKKLKIKSAEFEIWVTYNGWGDYTWAVSRYRKNSKMKWNWLNESFANPDIESAPTSKSTVLLPRFLDPKMKSDWDEIFNNTPVDLYQRPLFGSTLWLSRNKMSVAHAWLPTDEMEIWEQRLKNTNLIAAELPPPSRFGDVPMTYVVKVNKITVAWPIEFTWVKENHAHVKPIEVKPKILSWPKNMSDNFTQYVKNYSGANPIRSPLTGNVINVGKLGVAEKDNELLDVVAHLKQHYETRGFNEKPGLEVSEQFFMWRGIKQANLIAKIKGSQPDNENKPVILSDHIDKAIAEDIYEKTKRRITNPGADDNSTATATLLVAADLLVERYKDNQPKQDIYFVHFTGEEFPGSSLGARYFISDLLKRGIDISANINLDMMGHRTAGDRIFQINPGFSQSSWNLAQVAFHAAKVHAAEWDVRVRHPWAKNSYITQTDATFFDYAGYPTILINEHMNLTRRLNPHYHQSIDTYEKVDFPYALSQAKVAIETAVRMAE